jgi:hypothetical protein
MESDKKGAMSLRLALLLSLAPVAALASAKSPAPVHALPFIENDYARALAEAKAKKLPLFVEAWAPW